MAWDDIGSQSKFMIVNTQKGYQGIYGHLSTEVKKGICPLCQHESTVSMFLSLTKVVAMEHTPNEEITFVATVSNATNKWNNGKLWMSLCHCYK